ncbi:MAG: hypothetical protein MUC56_15650 [Thermoanaerobaculales bacterium]|nr:hypothetical protein [Thermoanaerobaculales bacterium]
MHDPDRLLRHGAMLTAAAVIAHPLNLGFHLAAGRLIPTGEYGTLVALLGALALLGAPLTAVRMVVTHAVATDPATGGLETARRWARLTALLGLGSAVAAVLLADRISLRFGLGSPLTVWALAVALVPIALNPVVRGRIQGLQLFGWLAVLGIVAAATRLGFGCLLMLVRPTAASALLATAAAALATLALGIAVSDASRPGDPPGATGPPPVALALVPTTLAVFGLTGLQHLDLVILKLLAEPDPAGQYAQASLLGRSLPYLTLPLANALFPKSAALGLTADRGRRLFLRAVLLSLGAAAGAVAAFSLAPREVLALIFGSARATPELAALALRIVPAFLPLAVTGPAVYAALAGRRRRVATILVAGTIALALGALVAGGDPRGTTAVVAVVQSAVALAVVIAALARSGRPPVGSGPA